MEQSPNVLLTEQSRVQNNVSSSLYLYKRKARAKNIENIVDCIGTDDLWKSMKKSIILCVSREGNWVGGKEIFIAYHFIPFECTTIQNYTF